MTDPVFLCDGCPQDPQAVAAAAAVLEHGPGQSVTITGDEGFHAVTVKRISCGDTITVTNGHGVAATVRVTDTTGKDRLTGTIVGGAERARPAVGIAVVQALPKSDRAESPVQLATQAGAAVVVPWQAERCIAKWKGAKKDRAQAKWRSAAIEAAKQSRRTTVPRVTDMVTTAQLAGHIARVRDNGSVVIVLDENARQPLTGLAVWDRIAAGPVGGDTDPDALFSGCDVVVIVGPEGGIGDGEKQRLIDAGAIPALLGPEVFRTVTAAMAACVAVSVLTGRW
ncbi:16S rRNA (uracil(1498)-N(3))-methyltransferase [Corynebacterium mendelii]|uniref:16S rRNA (uracil(1498)-N(3))-methyltransferase n=1 Tax=Corynebacterium mendelii TaxID=2765362 RepID=UPI002ECFBBCD